MTAPPRRPPAASSSGRTATSTWSRRISSSPPDEVRVALRLPQPRARGRCGSPSPSRCRTAICARDGEGDVAYPTDFRTRVDGRPVRMQVERKALLGGVDHTAAAAPARHPDRAADGLSTPVRSRGDRPAAAGASSSGSSRLGLVERLRTTATGAQLLTASGRCSETWYWEQVFPAGRDLVVEHRYRPGAGGTVGTALGNRRLSRRASDGREMIARLLHRRRLPRRASTGSARRDRRARRSSGAAGSAISSPPAATGARRSAISGWWSTRARRRIWSASAARACARSARPSSRCAAATGGRTATSTC